MEIDKTTSLKISKGNFDMPCHISDKGMHNIDWWKHNLPSAVKSLLPLPRIDHTIFTDTGKFGAHSCQSAATSAADLAGIELSTIAKAAGWSGTNIF